MTADEFYALRAEEFEGNPELIDGEVVYRSARIPPFGELEIVLDHLFLPPAKNR